MYTLRLATSQQHHGHPSPHLCQRAGTMWDPAEVPLLAKQHAMLRRRHTWRRQMQPILAPFVASMAAYVAHQVWLLRRDAYFRRPLRCASLQPPHIALGHRRQPTPVLGSPSTEWDPAGASFLAVGRWLTSRPSRSHKCSLGLNATGGCSWPSLRNSSHATNLRATATR